MKSLKEERVKRGISQAYMAKQLGISRPTYMRIESNPQSASIEQARLIVNIFAEDLYQIFLPKNDSFTNKERHEQ